MKKRELQLRSGKRPLIELAVIAASLVLGLSILSLGHQTTGTLTYDGGKITYTGEIKNSRMNGKGKLTYDNGDVYEGELVNGVFSGQGKFTSSKGWTYEGEFRSGQPHGKGKLTAKDKTVYKGQFKQGIYQK